MNLRQTGLKIIYEEAVCSMLSVPYVNFSATNKKNVAAGFQSQSAAMKALKINKIRLKSHVKKNQVHFS